MQMDKLNTLEPDFKEIVETVISETQKATGYTWKASDGRRTMAEQKAIYAQGRTVPGKVVTNAPPGNSPHNFGLAADLWPLKGGDFWWGAPKSLFHTMADIAEENGLKAGYYFKSIFDAPHIEMPRWKEQQALWKNGKVQVA
jgi:peptidoglycan LD-endopeptidase CwlK